VGYVCRDLEERCTTVEGPLRKVKEEINVLNRTIETLTRDRMTLEHTVNEMLKEKEGLIHELKCSRIEIEGYQREMVVERERLERVSEMERGGWKDREEELLMTNRVLDEELRETQTKVKEWEEKVIQ
jgi:chromosome segregation ATPase